MPCIDRPSARRRRALGWLLPGLLVWALVAGCSKGPQTFQVSGTVSFDGKPVPAGRVDFFPDLAQNNDGPQGFAIIKAGKFDTRDKGQGHGGGPMLIRIAGFDGQADNPAHFGKPIFKLHEIKKDLPKEDTLQTFEVPASAAKGLIVPATPPKT